MQLDSLTAILSFASRAEAAAPLVFLALPPAGEGWGEGARVSPCRIGRAA
jgi:hypothetical protein